jgi:hypothetical protein
VDRASSSGLFDAANLSTTKGFFTARPEAIKKKLRSRGGFEGVSPLSHMNRHQIEHAGENQNRNQTLERKTHAN